MVKFELTKIVKCPEGQKPWICIRNWIRIRIGKNSMIRIRIETNADQKHCNILSCTYMTNLMM